MPTVIRVPKQRMSSHGKPARAMYRDEARAASLLASNGSQTRRWKGVIGVEGEVTGDARMIEKGALRWENLPLPLRFVDEDEGGHDGAQVVGRIDTVTREGGLIIGEGDLDMGSKAGREAIRQVEEKWSNGVSMDLDDVSFEFRVAQELLDEGEGEMEPMPEDEDDPSESKPPEADADGRVTVAEIHSDDAIEVTTDARVRAATLVSIPAFDKARIELVDAADDPESDPDTEETTDHEDTDDELAAAVTAAGIPVDPPVAWFNNPKLDGPTPIHITEHGQIYGHIAAWNTCHTGQPGGCTPPPRSQTNYAYFLTGSILTREGAEIPVGHLTADTRHAASDASPSATLRHYDHTGTAIADVTCGEDDYGIWVAGAVRPSATPEQLRVLRSSPISGDWRRIGTNLELVAALAVNVPGFPIPRTSGLVAGASMQTLVAAGMLPPEKVIKPGRPGALSPEDLRYLKRLAARERSDQAEAMAAMARRVKASALASRVRSV